MYLLPPLFFSPPTCPELLQREQAEMAQQLANLQTDVRMSYGNDALMPDQELGDGQTDLLPQEDTVGLGGVGFIHPESFNQPNTENQGARQSTCTLVPLNWKLSVKPSKLLCFLFLSS